MDTAAPTATTAAPSGRAAARATSAEADGGFAAELRRAVDEPAKNREAGDAASRPEAPTDAGAPTQPDAVPLSAPASLSQPDAGPAMAPAAAVPAAELPCAIGGAALPAGAPATDAAASPTETGDAPAQAVGLASPSTGAATSADRAGDIPTAAVAPGAVADASPPRGLGRQGDAGPASRRDTVANATPAALGDTAGDASARAVAAQGAFDGRSEARSAGPAAPLLRGAAEAFAIEQSQPVPRAAASAPEAVASSVASAASAGTAQPPAGTPAAAAAAPSPSPRPTPPPLPPARQVAPIAIALALGTGGAPRLSVALEPEELGRVEIRVERGADGDTATVRVVAERPETLALLQRDARQLDRALQGAGIPLAEGAMQFSLAGREERASGEGAKNTGDDGGGARRDRRGGAAPDAAPDPVPPARAMGLSLLDIAI